MINRTLPPLADTSSICCPDTWMCMTHSDCSKMNLNMLDNKDRLQRRFVLYYSPNTKPNRARALSYFIKAESFSAHISNKDNKYKVWVAVTSTSNRH